MAIADPVIVDTSCLIGLERIGHLDILPALFHPIFAPPAVAAEFGSTPDWLVIKAPADAAFVARLKS